MIVHLKGKFWSDGKNADEREIVVDLDHVIFIGLGYSSPTYGDPVPVIFLYHKGGGRIDWQQPDDAERRKAYAMLTNMFHENSERRRPMFKCDMEEGTIEEVFNGDLL